MTRYLLIWNLIRASIFSFVYLFFNFDKKNNSRYTTACLVVIVAIVGNQINVGVKSKF